MNLTDDQLDTLRHMLGINDPDLRESKPYRNYYAACPGDPKLAALAETGAVRLSHGPRPGLPYDCYVCTVSGIQAAIQSHRTIRRTKAQRTYSKYLDHSDVCPDLTFREFLTLPEFAAARREA